MEASATAPGGQTGVAVVTDSTPYLPPEMIDSLGVQQVNLYVGWDGDLKPEDSYADLDAFYRRLHDVRQPADHLAAVGRRLRQLSTSRW